MARRRSAKQDSLELLLDTICNTFGGVLFIAILVVLLLQQTGKGPGQPASLSKPVTAVEMLDLTNRFEDLSSQLTRLRENRGNQQVVVQTFATTEMQIQLQERTALTNELAERQNAVDQMMLERAELSVRVEQLTQENEAVPEQLKESKAKEEQLTAKLEELIESNRQELRLPVLKESDRPVIALILKYGRLYLWNLSNSIAREGLNDQHFVAVGHENKDTLITMAHPLRGIELDDRPQTRDQIRSLLVHVSPKKFHLAIVVRPDSFYEFRYARDAIVELGFNYQLFPMQDGEAIYDSGGTSNTGVQ